MICSFLFIIRENGKESSWLVDCRPSETMSVFTDYLKAHINNNLVYLGCFRNEDKNIYFEYHNEGIFDYLAVGCSLE